jgi:hypothetical protein
MNNYLHNFNDSENRNFLPSDIFLPNAEIKRYLFGINECSIQLAEIIKINGFIDDFTSKKEIGGHPIYKTFEVDLESVVINCTFSITPVTAEKKIKNNF